MILGIDPGLTGALVMIGEGGIYRAQMMPTREKGYGKGRTIDEQALTTFFTDNQHLIIKVIIERQGVMPGQGISGMFSLGHTVGVLTGICTVFDFHLIWVRSQQWKKSLGLLRTTKAEATDKAIALYPDLEPYVRLKKHQGIADACLIAHWGLNHAE